MPAAVNLRTRLHDAIAAECCEKAQESGDESEDLPWSSQTNGTRGQVPVMAYNNVIFFFPIGRSAGGRLAAGFL